MGSMDDTRRNDDPVPAASEDGADDLVEVLAASDPAEAPEVAEELADRLAEALAAVDRIDPKGSGS